MEKIRILINIWRLIPAYILLKNSKMSILRADFARWKEIYYRIEESDFSFMSYALIHYKEFRNLFAYRLEKAGKKIARNIFATLFPLYDSLFIHAKDIGEGLFIQHGFATIITAEHIGKNCFINQQVTIGADKPGESLPWIGDNVRICAGVIIIGNVKINDNAVIGAGAVVVKDVDESDVVAGVPAKHIKKKDE